MISHVVTHMGKVRMEMKNNNYASFFKTKPKKVERYIRCRKCGAAMDDRDFPFEIKCHKCGYSFQSKPWGPQPMTAEEITELYCKLRYGK